MPHTSAAFINLSNPDQVRQSQIQRTIRSHAAKVSASQLPAGRSRYHARCPGRRKYQTFLLQKQDVELAAELTTCQLHWPESKKGATTKLTKPDLSTPLAGYAGSLPVCASPLFSKPYVPSIIANYLENLAGPIPEIDGSSHVALMRTVWFPIVLHSPTIFAIIVLFSASHFMWQNPGDVALHEVTILHLKSLALRSLNELASSPTLSSGDELIAAGAKMASFEAIFGKSDEYHTHMSSVSKIVQERGGLNLLGMNGFLARLLVFVDTNSAYLLNTRLHLPESSFPRREPVQIPNINRFIGSRLPTNSKGI